MGRAMAIQKKFTTTSCPAPLRGLQAFLTWDYVDGRKIPFYANGSRRSGQQGSEADRAQLVSYEDALQAARRRGHSGVGLALLPDLGIVAGDFDHCVTDGQVDPRVEQLVYDTYAEFSPSGTGVRAIWFGDLGNHKDPHPEDGSFGLETFSSKGFVTITGNTLPHVGILIGPDDIAQVSDKLRQVCDFRFGQVSSPSDSANEDFLARYEPQDILTLDQIEQGLSVLSPEMNRSSWLQVGMALHYDQHGSDEAFHLWHEWSAQATGVNDRGRAVYQGEEDCRKTWDSFGRHRDRKLISGKTFIKRANEAGAELFVADEETNGLNGSLKDTNGQSQAANGQSQATFEALDPPPASEAPRPLPATEKPRQLVWTSPEPIGPEEWTSSHLSPRCIVENYLYADVALLAAPGGVGKTTLMLYEAIHITLGLPLWGLKVKTPGPVLILTAEDDRGLLVARLREIANTLELTPEQLAIVMQDVRISDLTGQFSKLTRLGEDGTIKASPLVKQIIDGCANDPRGAPVLITIDPAISFGVGEAQVNDAEQALVEVARRFKRALNCAVRYIHHTGKSNARLKELDQYAGRGGSTFPDGSRMVQVMATMDDREWKSATGLDLQEGQLAAVLARPKLSYAPPQPHLFILRDRFTYTLVPARTTEEAEEQSAEDVAEFIWNWLGQEWEEGRYHSKRNAEALLWPLLEVSRATFRQSFAMLESQGRIDPWAEPPEGATGRGGRHRVTKPIDYHPWAGVSKSA